MSREWSSPRSYIVPRNLPFEMPRGWAWAGKGRRGRIGPYDPAWIVTWDLWPSEVAEVAAAVLIVGAVRMELGIAPGSAHWPVMPDMPRTVKTLQPTLVQMPWHGALRVSTSGTSRSGEVWCWPLKEVK